MRFVETQSQTVSPAFWVGGGMTKWWR